MLTGICDWLYSVIYFACINDTVDWCLNHNVALVKACDQGNAGNHEYCVVCKDGRNERIRDTNLFYTFAAAERFAAVVNARLEDAATRQRRAEKKELLEPAIEEHRGKVVYVKIGSADWVSYHVSAQLSETSSIGLAHLRGLSKGDAEYYARYLARRWHVPYSTGSRQ